MNVLAWYGVNFKNKFGKPPIPFSPFRKLGIMSIFVLGWIFWSNGKGYVVCPYCPSLPHPKICYLFLPFNNETWQSYAFDGGA